LKNVFFAIALFFALSFAGEGPVSYYGKLKVSGNKLVGSKTGSTSVQVRGVSFGWTTTGWESARFYTTGAAEHMIKDWKAEVVRAAYGATSSPFASNQTAKPNRDRVETIVEAAIANDTYVIIDWHSHNAHNEVDNSKDFFDYMAEKYGSNDHVIFEIYNEPLCSDGSSSCAASARTTWAEVKTYAEQIIPVIRKHSSNLILVGTPQWSQRIDQVIGNTLNDDNVGYVFHFYSASHSVGSFGGYVNKVIDANLLVFVTEYGTTDSGGGQSSDNKYDTHNAAKTDEWHSLMDEKKISSAAWEVNDKYAGSAFFGIEGAAKKFDLNGSWTDESKMTDAGKYIFKKLNDYAKSAPWRGSSPIANSANLQNFEQANAEVYSLSGKKIGNFANVNLQNGVYILISKQNGVVQKKVLKIVK